MFGGLDVGSSTTKAVIIDENGSIVSFVINASASTPKESAQNALNQALKKAVN